MTEYQFPIIYLDTTDSTNLFAQDLLRNHEVLHGTVVSASRQLQGRGQRGHQWLSATGLNLTFSIILMPTQLAVNRHFELNMVFSLGISDYLSAIGVNEIKVKWPNDVLVRGKKLAGILLENTIRGETIHTIIAGIGININQEEFDGEYTIQPTSLKQILQKSFDLKTALNDVLKAIWHRYEQLINQKTEILRADYHALLFKLNEPCTFSTEKRNWDGFIRGINKEGQLLIEEKNGMIVPHSITSISMQV